jgi:hypothetical protein
MRAGVWRRSFLRVWLLRVYQNSGLRMEAGRYGLAGSPVMPTACLRESATVMVVLGAVNCAQGGVVR